MQNVGFEYARRQPETSVLYQVVAGELETFLDRQRERDHAVPRFVEDEFRSFLDCGILARGFVRVHCQSCGHDRLVAFSCKGRAWCPSCGGRKMANTAAHLVDRVFPIVPVRQWVLSLPFALRYRTAYDSRLTTSVLTVFMRALFGELQRRARELLGLRSVQCGAVTFIQRFGDALNANIHFHTLAIDGVYCAAENGKPEFHVLPAPEDEDVLRLAAVVAEATIAFVKRLGDDDESADPLSNDEPGMAVLLANSIQRKIAVGDDRGRAISRIGDHIDGDALDLYTSPRCAMVTGFSVHANVAIEARDRMRLERLCRYAARPAIATERLTALPDGRLLYRLKRPWRDGTSAMVFDRQDFMAKLAALVPAPRTHLVRYHGILGPAARWRRWIVPHSETAELQSAASAAAPLPSTPPENETTSSRPSGKRNHAWAELMKRVFQIDVLLCERCGGRLNVIAAIHPPETTRKILNHLGLPSRPPPLAPAIHDFILPVDSF